VAAGGGVGASVGCAQETTSRLAMIITIRINAGFFISISLWFWFDLIGSS
jgi:hypothetical protein